MSPFWGVVVCLAISLVLGGLVAAAAWVWRVNEGHRKIKRGGGVALQAVKVSSDGGTHTLNMGHTAYARGAAPRKGHRPAVVVEIEGDERQPTHDEAAGIAWWNGLSEHERARWMQAAGNTGVPADAWAAFKEGRAAL